MQVTNVVMCDERSVLLGFATNFGLKLSMNSDPFWRLGERVPMGDRFPVYIERDQFPYKQSIPVLGFERYDDGDAAEEGRRLRALIPIAAICARSTDAGSRDSSDLKVGGLSDYAFIAGLADRTENHQICSGVTGLATSSCAGRSSWITWEPIVISHSQAARWVRRQMSLSELSPENASLIEVRVPWEMR